MDSKPLNFRASVWVKCLAQSLALLKQTEEKYCSELSPNLTDDNGLNVQMSSSPRSFFENRYFLYHKANSSKNSSHYRILCSALDEVKALLRKHPPLNRALGSSDNNEEIRIAIANSLRRISLIDIAVRLMNYGTEGDFDDVALRLRELLPFQGKRKFPGYHISVFLGLRLDEEIQLSDELSIAPFGSVKKFINPSDLENIVRNSKQFAQTGSLGVVIKPFEWNPIIAAAGKKLESDIKWDEGFPKDAETIVNLLSIVHGVPVINIICFEFCVPRQISELLGTPIGGGAFIRHTEFSVNHGFSSEFPSMEKSLQVKDLFSRLKNSDEDQRRRYESVISRLSNSLSRKGRFGTEDKILDVAIALELMYELDSEVTYKLATRTSCFLEKNTQNRVEIFNKTKKFYDARSSVVHYRKKKKLKNISGQFDNGFDLARRTLFKLLKDGSPPDWDTVILSDDN